MDRWKRHYFALALIATLLAYTVVLLGAYTRLSDAGLGCPDWPGCDGQLIVPQSQAALKRVEHAFPTQKVESAKAWKEMIHRYFAGTLGLVILALAVWALWRKRKDIEQSVWIPLILLLAVIFQATLGMWTVTLKLLPLVVMAHLLGGMTILALLWGLTLSSGKLYRHHTTTFEKCRPWAILGLIILSIQIFLGGWTSANYAAVICPHFPYCRGSLFPHMNFREAFNFFSPLGANYEGGVLGTTARITIQMTHRYGAFITASYLGALSLCLIVSKKTHGLRALGWILLIVLGTQMTLGVLNIELLLPMAVAVAHNGIAALLLLTVVTLIYKLYTKPIDEIYRQQSNIKGS